MSNAPWFCQEPHDAGMPPAGGPEPKAGDLAGASAGCKPADRLEEESYKRIDDSLRIEFRDCRCGCRTCPKCGPRKGWKVRSRLLTHAPRFSNPLLLTLTVDRSNFDNPEQAHERVSKDGLIRRLMQRLGIPLWVWVLEFQGASGLGWPHWHVLVDASDLPRKRIDLTRAWHLWRDEWKIGGLDVREATRFRSPAHAVMYITKYLTKFPATGFPVWVLEHEQRVRFFQGSKVLGPLVADPTPPADEPEDAQQPSEDDEQSPATVTRRPMRTLIDRMAECGTASNAILIMPDGTTGTTTREWLGQVDANWSRLSMLVREAKLMSPVDVLKVTEFFGDDSLTQFRPYLFEIDSRTLKEAFERLRTELTCNGEMVRRLNLIAERRIDLLKRNVFAQREAQAAEQESQGGQP